MYQTEQTSRMRPRIFFISDVSVGNWTLSTSTQTKWSSWKIIYTQPSYWAKIRCIVHCTASQSRLERMKGDLNGNRGQGDATTLKYLMFPGRIRGWLWQAVSWLPGIPVPAHGNTNLWASRTAFIIVRRVQVKQRKFSTFPFLGIRVSYIWTNRVLDKYEHTIIDPVISNWVFVRNF